MAEHQLESIYKYLQLLPEFDGNPNVLKRFIKMCDNIINNFVNVDPDNKFVNMVVIDCILNKITGQAAQIINNNDIPEKWDDIKQTLIKNFTDGRDEADLVSEFFLLRQGFSSSQQFYEQCQNHFSTIMAYISLHDESETIIEAKQKLYKKLTFQAFLRGLNEPLGSRIRCMRPETIEKAYEYLQEELKIIKLQEHNNLINKSSPFNAQFGYNPQNQSTFGSQSFNSTSNSCTRFPQNNSTNQLASIQPHPRFGFGFKNNTQPSSTAFGGSVLFGSARQPPVQGAVFDIGNATPKKDDNPN